MDPIFASSDLPSLDMSTLRINWHKNDNSSVVSETSPGTSPSSEMHEVDVMNLQNIPTTNSSSESPLILDTRDRENSSSSSTPTTQSSASPTSFLFAASRHPGLIDAFKNKNLRRKLITIAFPYKDWVIDIMSQKDGSDSDHLVLVYNFYTSNEISAPQRERLAVKVMSVLAANGIEDVNVVVDISDESADCTRPFQLFIDYNIENHKKYLTEDFPMVGASIGQDDRCIGTLAGYVSIDGPCAGRYALTCHHCAFCYESGFRDEPYLSSAFKSITDANKPRCNKYVEGEASDDNEDDYNEDYSDEEDYYDNKDKWLGPITSPSNLAIYPLRHRLIQQYADKIEDLPEAKNDPRNEEWGGHRWRHIFESMMRDEERIGRSLTPLREYPRGEKQLWANEKCAEILKKAYAILAAARPLGEAALGSGMGVYNEEFFDWILISLDKYRFGKDKRRAKNILPPVSLSPEALAAFDAGLPTHLHLSSTLDPSAIELSRYRTKAQIERAQATADESRLRVLKFGARSGWTVGKINPFPSYHLDSIHGVRVEISVLNLVGEEDFVMPGDSGSLVFDRFGEVVGMVYASPGQYGGRIRAYVMPMESLMDNIAYWAYADRVEMDCFETKEMREEREEEERKVEKEVQRVEEPKCQNSGWGSFEW